MAVRSVLLRLLVATLLISNVIGADTPATTPTFNNVDGVEDTGTTVSTESTTTYIADFSKTTEVATWTERSDTMSTGGMSKWAAVYYNTTSLKGSLFFFAVYPGVTGIPYCGGRKLGLWDLSKNTGIKMTFIAQGPPFKYRILLRHQHLDEEPNPIFNIWFTALNTTKKQSVKLPLDQFIPTVLEVVNDTIIMDRTQITSFKVQSTGGVIGTRSLLLTSIVPY